MPKTASLALPVCLLLCTATAAPAQEPVREENSVKQDCMSKEEVIALLRESGFDPVEEPSHNDGLWAALTKRRKIAEDGESGTGERDTGKDRTGALVLVNGCTGKIMQVNKALLPEEE